MLHYTVLTFEQMWMARNRIRMGKFGQPNREELAKRLNLLLQTYWSAAVSQLNTRRRIPLQQSWSPPSLGELKFNFDVSLIDCATKAAIVLRNQHGQVIGA